MSLSRHHALPLLTRRKGGLVVEMTDGTAEYNASNYGVSAFYDLAKSAVLRWAWSQGHELAGFGCTRRAVVAFAADPNLARWNQASLSSGQPLTGRPDSQSPDRGDSPAQRPCRPPPRGPRRHQSGSGPGVRVLASRSLAVSKAFYGEVLGWQPVMDHGWIVTLADTERPGFFVRDPEGHVINILSHP